MTVDLEQRPGGVNVLGVTGRPFTATATFVVTGTGAWTDLDNFAGHVYNANGAAVTAYAPAVTSPSSGVLTISWTAAQTTLMGGAGYTFEIDADLFGAGPCALLAGAVKMARPGTPGSSTSSTVTASAVIGGTTLSVALAIGGSASGGGGSMTGAQILTAIKTVDGSGSGLDADLLDGLSSAAFALTGDAYTKAASDSRYDSLGAATAAQAAAIAASQPVDADLTAIAALTTTVFGRALLTMADAAATITALGLAALYQPLDSDLTAIAALTTTAFGRSLLTQADAAATISTLGLASIYQPLDSDLTAIAALTTTATGRSLLAAANAAAIQTIAGTVIGTNVQAWDADLDSIAAVATTAYGRAFLALANQAALMALLTASDTSTSGIVELATSAETITGTDTVRAVTPAGGRATYPLYVRTDANSARTISIGTSTPGSPATGDVWIDTN